MADTTLPTAGTYAPGHTPFYLRVSHALKSPGTVVTLVEVRGQIITIRDNGVEQTLWTHPPAAAHLANAFARGTLELSRFGADLFIVDGITCSLIHPDGASLSREPDSCRHGRLISVRTGLPWDGEDTRAQECVVPST